jgi:acyl-coenzyme A thioesterase PaaI-like protein
MSDALFRREGGLFVPGDKAASPWGAGLLHGGAPAALLAFGAEQAKANAALFVSRLTIDLFRPVPKAPLELRTKDIRTGRRIQVLESSLWHEGVEMCRATALLLMP